MTQEPGSDKRLTRRRLLIGAGAAGAGIGLGAGGYLVGRDEAGAAEDSGAGTGTVAFHGTHQAGIATPAQDRMQFASFDLTIDDRGGLRDLLRDWTEAGERMTAGEATGPENANQYAPPDDTGETVGLAPSRLTITFGFGPGMFGHGSEAGDRFGLAAARPGALKPLPYLPNDQLSEQRSGGDLCVQACADDPQVAFHAIRNLARIGRGKVVVRWSQLGFGRTSSTSTAQATPRNLMGFKDGTENIKSEDAAAMSDFVWLGSGEGQPWMRGGTYMVTRRIRMLLEIWDRAALSDQEQTFGRHKASGAPLGASEEFDELPLEKKKGGVPVIPVDAHVRLASPDVNSGQRILRRGYSFNDGVDERLGQLEAGLFFIAFQRDPIKQFFAIQQRLGRNDALNEYIKHVASAVFAIPRGVKPGEYVGQELLENA